MRNKFRLFQHFHLTKEFQNNVRINVESPPPLFFFFLKINDMKFAWQIVSYLYLNNYNNELFFIMNYCAPPTRISR